MTNRRTFMIGAAAAIAAPAIVYSRGMGEFAHFVANREPRFPLNITHLAMCNAAEEAIHQGGGKHHIFFAPRASGKTTIFSHALPAWRLSSSADSGIHVSRAADVANYNRYLVSRMFSSPANVDLKRWCYSAPGNALAGYRGDLVVLDDPELSFSHRDNNPWTMQLFNRVTPTGTLIAVGGFVQSSTGILSFIAAGNNVTIREFT